MFVILPTYLFSQLNFFSCCFWALFKGGIIRLENEKKKNRKLERKILRVELKSIWAYSGGPHAYPISSQPFGQSNAKNAINQTSFNYSK
jgi:hypothetical protein